LSSARQGSAAYLLKEPLMIKRFAAPLLVAVLSLSSLALSGCSNDDVGYPCQLGQGTGTGTGTSVGSKPSIVVSNSLDCLSRLCVRPTTSVESAVGLCSKMCDSDGDCPGPNAACATSVGGTPQKYVCRVVAVTGGLKCCKMCVCEAFAGAADTAPTECANFAATCPKL
jgi:hypothetical protein